MAQPTKSPDQLLPGDRFEYRGTVVEITAGPRPAEDLFGRSMIEYTAVREDTGAEGPIMFGPTATIRFTILGEAAECIRPDGS